MIACPNCNHDNMAGAAFCVECGAMLMQPEALTTQKIQPNPVPVPFPVPVSAPSAPHKPAHPVAASDTWLTLHLMDSGEMLPLAERNEFTLGRVSEGQPVMPDIDLGPYQAYTHGVSRLHAVIRRAVDHVMLSDLESANGTFVNGQRLPPNEERPLTHGDVISLGGLKMQVLLRSS